MSKIYRLIFNDYDREDADRRTLSLAGLAVSLLIVVVCVFLLKQLQSKTAIEDCLMAGRNNCDALITKLR